MSGRQPDAPVRVPVSLQRWEDLTFLHWAYDPAQVQRLVPPPLRVQHWQGRTWVGVSPFRMRDVRAPGLPPPPGWGAFAEVNIRSYVRGPDGRDGIWFLGLVAAPATFVLALRTLGVPYRRATCRVDTAPTRLSYRFGTPSRGISADTEWFAADVEVGPLVADAARDPLLDSLTGRWSAYHRRAAVLWRTPVEHPPWPLRHARVCGRDLTAPLRWAGLPEPEGPPTTHAAAGVDVRLGLPRPASMG